MNKIITHLQPKFIKYFRAIPTLRFAYSLSFSLEIDTQTYSKWHNLVFRLRVNFIQFNQLQALNQPVYHCSGLSETAIRQREALLHIRSSTKWSVPLELIGFMRPIRTTIFRIFGSIIYYYCISNNINNNAHHSVNSLVYGDRCLCSGKKKDVVLLLSLLLRRVKTSGQSSSGDKTNVFSRRRDVCGVLSYICG